MNPNHSGDFDLFRHFNPDLWIASKKAHITLFSIGCLFIIPAVYGLFMMVMLLTGGFGFGSPNLEGKVILSIASIAGSISTGTLAWSALGFLFFKRADARWQRISWNICATYGWVGLISSVAWFIYLLMELDFSPNETTGAILFYGIFLLLILSALACIICGHRHASAAKKFLQSAKANHPSSAP